MHKKNIKLQITCLLSFIFLTACGEGPIPSALQPVEDEAGEIVQSNEGQVTLLQAILKRGVPSRLAKEALYKFDKFVEQVKKPSFITMIDFSQHSSKRRMYIVNRKTGEVEALSVAHGSGSDPDNDGFPQFFSNVPNSKMSSLGSFIISEEYTGKYGTSMRLDGLEKSNSNARDRAVVLHPAGYVKDGLKKQGRSWGCPAVPYDWIGKLIERTKEGGFLYAFGINKRKGFDETEMVRQWDMIPLNQWVNESEDAPIDGE